MIYLYGAVIAVGLVGLYLRSRALKRARIRALIQAYIDDLVDLFEDEGEGSA
jgi:hypothetical protein